MSVVIDFVDWMHIIGLMYLPQFQLMTKGMYRTLRFEIAGWVDIVIEAAKMCVLNRWRSEHWLGEFDAVVLTY